MFHGLRVLVSVLVYSSDPSVFSLVALFHLAQLFLTFLPASAYISSACQSRNHWRILHSLVLVFDVTPIFSHLFGSFPTAYFKTKGSGLAFLNIYSASGHGWFGPSPQLLSCVSIKYSLPVYSLDKWKPLLTGFGAFSSSSALTAAAFAPRKVLVCPLWLSHVGFAVNCSYLRSTNNLPRIGTGSPEHIPVQYILQQHYSVKYFCSALSDHVFQISIPSWEGPY